MEVYLAPIIIGVVLISIFLFAVFKANKFTYTCSKCGKIAKFNPFVAALAPQSQGKKYLACPHCKRKQLFSLKYKG